MSDLTNFRDHARAMSTAEHLPECGAWQDTRWSRRFVAPNPECAGCVNAADRKLWARLADEADAYLDREPEETLL